jgi:hypothetical protein
MNLGISDAVGSFSIDFSITSEWKLHTFRLADFKPASTDTRGKKLDRDTIGGFWLSPSEEFGGSDILIDCLRIEAARTPAPK